MNEPIQSPQGNPSKSFSHARVTWECPSHSPEEQGDPIFTSFAIPTSWQRSEQVLNVVILGTMLLLLAMMLAVFSAG